MEKINLENILEEVKEKNYAVLPFSISKAELDKAAEDFMQFLTLPQEVKDKFHFKLDERNRGSNIGYVNKKQESGDNDNKEYFHYNLYAEDLLEKIPESENITEVKKFFDSARYIYSEAVETMSKVLKELDKKYPGLHDEFLEKKPHPLFYLRFLKYEPAGKGRFLAKAHYDRGAFTLALAESAPGLRVGRNDKNLKEVKRVTNTALFMPGLSSDAYVSDSMTPAWHDVVQTGEDILNNTTARWAIVFFADSIIDNDISFEDAHTPRK